MRLKAPKAKSNVISLAERRSSVRPVTKKLHAQPAVPMVDPRRKAALYRKVCADCGHRWAEHYAGFCRGSHSGYNCFCVGFSRTEGDVL